MAPSAQRAHLEGRHSERPTYCVTRSIEFGHPLEDLDGRLLRGVLGLGCASERAPSEVAQKRPEERERRRDRGALAVREADEQAVDLCSDAGRHDLGEGLITGGR